MRTQFWRRTIYLLLFGLSLTACGGGGGGSSSASTGGGGGGNATACINGAPVFTGPNPAGDISFQSVTPTRYSDLLDNCNGLTSATVMGTLSLPAGATAAVPAMVIGHGSSGISNKHTDWVNLLNAIGIATFVVDSYTSRGVTNGQNVSSAVETADALHALAVLNSLPQIDNARIGMMDFGAGPGINTAFTEIKNSVNSGADFIAHVVLYANCNIRLLSANISSAAMLLLHGAADDWNAANDCVNFVNVLNNVGGNASISTYPGAYHGFDSNGAVSFSATTKSNTNCFGEFRIDTRTLRNFQTGGVFANATAYQNYRNACRTNGATSGGNTVARANAQSEVDSFLRSVFGI